MKNWILFLVLMLLAIPNASAANGSCAFGDCAGGGGSYSDGQAQSATGWTDGGTNVYLTTSTDKVGIGTNSPSKRFSLENGHVLFGKVSKPSAPTLASGGAGSLTGVYKYAVSYYTADGETEPSVYSSSITTASERVTVTIPTSSDNNVIGRRIYRTLAGATANTDPVYRVTTIADNSTTSYSDNNSDNTILANFVRYPDAAGQHNNTTGAMFYVKNSAGTTPYGLISTHNTFYGYNPQNPYLAGTYDGGYQNTAVGSTALNALTNGHRNTAVGSIALESTTNGDGNAAVGTYALGNLISGTSNSAMGHSALRSIRVGDYNTSIGRYSLYSLNPSNGNFITSFSDYSGTVAGTVKATITSHGLITGDSVRIGGTENYDGVYTVTVIDANNFYFTDTYIANETTGFYEYDWSNYNSALGAYAGHTRTMGLYNLFLGYEAGYALSGLIDGLSYASAIGAQAQVKNKNSMVLGGTGAAAVKVGIGEPRPESDLTFEGSAARTISVGPNITANTSGGSLSIIAGDATVEGAISTLSATPTAAGTGYKLGEVLTITTGGSGGTAVITGISGGTVTAVNLLTEGSAYTTGTGKATSGGSGSGCTLNITAVRTSTDKDGGNLILSTGDAAGTGSAYMSFYTTSTTGGSGTTRRTPTEKMRILANGTVGIGTTNPYSIAMTTGTVALDINNSFNGNLVNITRNRSTGTSADTRIGAESTDGDYLVLALPGESNSNTLFGQTRSNIGVLMTATTGGSNRDLAIGTNGAMKLFLGTNNAARATIDSSGNFGIGTTSPRSFVDIDKGTGVGQITLDGSTGGCFMLRDTDDAGWTECDVLDGVMTCSTDADGVCD